MNLKNFQILVLRNGYQVIQSFVHPPKYSSLGLIIGYFSSVSELEWFKSEVLKARSNGSRTYTGLNTFECHVSGDMCELYHEANPEGAQSIPTDIVLEYIEECIAYVKLYNSGGVPGIIPASKQNEWVIVPKSAVKPEYLKEIGQKDGN